MRKFIPLVLLLGLMHPIYAQEFLDVMRYSNTRQGGTARSMGMGGAIGATGIDYSVASINPSSLAQMRTSTAMATVALNFSNNSANYIDKDVKDNRFNFSIPNLGVTISTVLYHLGKEKKTGLINHTFAFGFNRVNDFNRNFTLDANNNQSSYLDYLAELGNEYMNWADVQNGLNPFYPEELALAAGGIVYDNNNAEFVANLPISINMRQLYRHEYQGRQTEWSAAWGGNISHVLYIGAGVNIPAIRYKTKETYIERGYDEVQGVDKSFEHTRELSTSGSGVNAKIGATVRANDWFRIGVAYHTPTAYSLSDQFGYTFSSRGFNSQFVYPDGEVLQSDPGVTDDYTITTPGKTVFSAAFIIKKEAMISMDYEMVNYTNAQISGTDLSFINTLVNDNLGSASNFRMGGEYNYLDFKFRGGIAVYASPFNQSILNSLTEGNLALRVYSLGFGYQEPTSNVYFDAAMVYERYDDFYTPYFLETSGRPYYTAFNEVRNTRLVFTIGTKF